MNLRQQKSNRFGFISVYEFTIICVYVWRGMGGVGTTSTIVARQKSSRCPVSCDLKCECVMGVRVVHTFVSKCPDKK